MSGFSGNAGVFERNRAECQRLADEARAGGDAAAARRWQDQADEWKRRRDRDQRHEQMRLLRGRAYRRF